ncbi:MAG: hypothetical protein ACO1G6_10795 [Bacteroidota bacterium]
MSFYIAIILFIVSVIAGLIISIIGKNTSKEKFFLYAAIHGMFLFAFIASLILQKDPHAFNYFFLTYICSGLILSGLAWRSNTNTVLKIYFSIFIITIGMFILSPSRLVNFLLTTKYKDTLGESFLVKENFFLERQSSSMSSENMPLYKLIRKRGIFHSTIARDLNFNGQIDSIKVLDFDKSAQSIIRGYTSKSTYVSTIIDSSDVSISMKKKTQDGLEYKL